MFSISSSKSPHYFLEFVESTIMSKILHISSKAQVPPPSVGTMRCSPKGERRGFELCQAVMGSTFLKITAGHLKGKN